MNAMKIDDRIVFFEGSKGFGSINLDDLLSMTHDDIAKIIDLKIESATRETGLDSQN